MGLEQPERSFNNKLVESMLNYTPDKDLPFHVFKTLVDDIENQQSFSLLLIYIKKNISLKLPELLRIINFDFSTNPKSFDAYTKLKEKIEELLKEQEKNNVVDEDKKEQIKGLLKVVKDTKIPK